MAGVNVATAELWFWTRFSLAEILVLAGTAGAGRMAPPASTGISAMMRCVQGHVSRVYMSALDVIYQPLLGLITCADTRTTQWQ